MNTKNSKSILIIAEHASAVFGGEAILPLHYFRTLRKRGTNVRLIVHERTKKELTTLFKNDLDRIYFIKDSLLHKIIHKSGQPLPTRIRGLLNGFILHLLTQFSAKKIARKLIKQHHVKIIHQPIPVSPKEPSLLFGMGVPVIIGPMNGGMKYPSAFRNKESIFTRIVIKTLRNFSHLLNILIPGKYLAHTLLCANTRTIKALPHYKKGRVIKLVENGVDLSSFQYTPKVENQQKQVINFVYIGRLIELKAVDILLDAVTSLSEVDIHFSIIGDGPMRPQLEEQTISSGLQDRVTFYGWIPQEKVNNLLQKQDALLLASLHECGGAVVLEAMACGLSVIATEWGGPIDYIDKSCGTLIPPADRQSMVEHFAKAIQELATNPEKRVQQGINGRKRVECFFDWEKKADSISKIYEECITTQ